MFKTYKYRLYPTVSQKQRINANIGACRFVYNLALEVKNQAYVQSNVRLSCFDLMAQLPELKRECLWLKEVDSRALQSAIVDLDKAFTSFFRGLSRFPKFKSKHNGSQAFRNPHGDRVRIKGGKLCLPKFTEGIVFIQDRQFNGEIKSTTISRTPTGKYFISVLVEDDSELPFKKSIREKTTIGIDLGISHFAITSDGIKYDNPRHLKKSLSHLKYLQRQTSKKIKGSSNRKKAVHKLALQHELVANQRKDFLQKLSSTLISENQTLVFEDLNVAGMIKNHCLAGAISDAGWGMFVDMCKYKAEWYGKNIIQLPRFEPSTKICSHCGATNHSLTLKDREWTCKCGTKHDRDINAAINIKNYGLKNCGGVHRKKPVELPTLVGALKQEVVNIPSAGTLSNTINNK